MGTDTTLREGVCCSVPPPFCQIRQTALTSADAVLSDWSSGTVLIAQAVTVTRKYTGRRLGK
ncbi:hypothetical protein Adi01nite_49810 [Amorphoplanes digitatis]|uniref:Uncharacterized protein n=1 Tax=Actinoplanes digitatis TaxID=1868 RepID=A0A7W7I5X0_9ACTN|nr:hypothetical protein [Actinoplanes digitatis]GID95569.1 hypothetical protein Adi01nite_49810 [Actinoplanes digitatis]